MRSTRRSNSYDERAGALHARGGWSGRADRSSPASRRSGRPSASPGASISRTRPPSSSPRRNRHYLSANTYDFYTGLGWEDHATTTFNPQGPNGAIYSPQVSVGAKQQVPRPAGGTEATQNIACDTTFLRPRGTLLYSCGQAETLSVDARVSLSWQQLGQAGVAIPAAPNTVPAPSDEPRRAGQQPPRADTARRSAHPRPERRSDDCAPGWHARHRPRRREGTDHGNRRAHDLAGYVQRAMAAQAQTANAHPISRVHLPPAPSHDVGTDTRRRAPIPASPRSRRSRIACASS